MQVYGAPFGIAFIVTVMISLFSGVLVGFISLRIEGIYLAILTLGLSEILRNTFISLKSSIKLDMSKVRLFGVKIGEEQVYLLILAQFGPAAVHYLQPYPQPYRPGSAVGEKQHLRRPSHGY